MKQVGSACFSPFPNPTTGAYQLVTASDDNTVQALLITPQMMKAQTLEAFEASNAQDTGSCAGDGPLCPYVDTYDDLKFRKEEKKRRRKREMEREFPSSIIGAGNASIVCAGKQPLFYLSLIIYIHIHIYIPKLGVTT